MASLSNVRVSAETETRSLKAIVRSSSCAPSLTLMLMNLSLVVATLLTLHVRKVKSY